MFWLVLLGTSLASLANTPLSPQWWSVGSPPPVSNSGHQPLAVANIGQAKYFAKCALQALRRLNPAVADAIEADLVGVGKPIPAWAVPAPGSPEMLAQYAPLLFGQLKAIADPFYTRLDAAHSSWLASQRDTNGTQDAADLSYIFPWTSLSADDSNLSIATVGQLKAVFALRFEQDSDGNQVPDLWVADNDGLTPEQEAALGTSPTLSDTDGDGVIDSEDAFPLDPTRWSLEDPVPGDSSPPLVSLHAPSAAIYVAGP